MGRLPERLRMKRRTKNSEVFYEAVIMIVKRKGSAERERERERDRGSTI